MTNWIKLIEAIASLAWPALGFVILFTFREEIKRLIPKVKKAHVPGVDVEFEQDLNKLEESAKDGAREMTGLFISNPSLLNVDLRERGHRIEVTAQVNQDKQESVASEAVKTNEEIIIDKIYQLIAGAPKTALLGLSDSIEKAMRRLMFSTGWLLNEKSITFPDAFDRLTSMGVFSSGFQVP